MNCSSAEALFERFLDGEVTPALRGRLLAHVDECPGCRGVLDELRVVDGLLVEPRRIELGPDFTHATMAETRALPPPVPYRAPVRAYLVSYLAAAWLIAGAGFLLAPQMMQELAGVLFGIARSVADAVGGLGMVVVRLFGRGGNLLPALLGALLVFDALLLAAFGLALKYVRPQLAERLRS